MATLKHPLPAYAWRGRTLDLPAGLFCTRVPHYPMQKGAEYWISEFPVALFPVGSIERHDAIHYGIIVAAEHVDP